MISREELKKALPYGAVSIIAKKAGVSSAAVSRYLNGNSKTSLKIEKAALECAIEYKKEVTHLITELLSIN